MKEGENSIKITDSAVDHSPLFHKSIMDQYEESMRKIIKEMVDGKYLKTQKEGE